MSIERLREEILEYHLRVEEVLAGMDREITALGNRLSTVEKSNTALAQGTKTGLDGVSTSMSDLKQRIVTLGEVVAQMTTETR